MSFVTLLTFLENVVVKIQLTSFVCTGVTASEASTPRFRSLLSELKMRVACPELLGASVCSSSRLLIVR